MSGTPPAALSETEVVKATAWMDALDRSVAEKPNPNDPTTKGSVLDDLNRVARTLAAIEVGATGNVRSTPTYLVGAAYILGMREGS